MSEWPDQPKRVLGSESHQRRHGEPARDSSAL